MSAVSPPRDLCLPMAGGKFLNLLRSLVAHWVPGGSACGPSHTPSSLGEVGAGHWPPGFCVDSISSQKLSQTSPLRLGTPLFHLLPRAPSRWLRHCHCDHPQKGGD